MTASKYIYMSMLQFIPHATLLFHRYDKYDHDKVKNPKEDTKALSFPISGTDLDQHVEGVHLDLEPP